MKLKIQAGTGLSTVPDATVAGCEAARAAMEELGGETPALIVVFACVEYDLHALLRAIRSVTGAAPLVGATTTGQFAEGVYLRPGVGAGVAVLALTAGSYRFGVASASNIGAELDAAGQALARASREAAGGAGAHNAILLLADGLVGDHQLLVQGIYRVTGPRVPTVGGAAADGQQFTGTYVFHDDAVLDGGAVAVWIVGEEPFQVVTGHGWTPTGVPMLVSRSEGPVVLEVAGRSAAMFYEQQLDPEQASLAREHFSDISVMHPLGMLQPDGTMLIRVPVAKTDAGAIKTFAAVPTGCAIQVMSGTADGLLAEASRIVEGAINQRPDAGVVLAFSCAARAMACGERIGEEAPRIQAAAGDVPTFGFYTYGEFARTRGVLGVHNATITTLTL